MRGGLVSGSRVTFVGDAMAAVIQGVAEVRDLIGETPGHRRRPRGAGAPVESLPSHRRP